VQIEKVLVSDSQEEAEEVVFLIPSHQRVRGQSQLLSSYLLTLDEVRGLFALRTE